MRRPAYARIRTRRQVQNQILFLAVIVGIMHFAVDIAADYLAREARTLVRATAIGVVGYALAIFEILKARRAQS